MADASGALDIWTRTCRLVLDQSGRARVHDTRAALNGIALGVEVLRHDDGRASGSTERTRVFELMRRDLTEAVDELSGLHALISTLAVEDLRRLGPALEWADRAARPVAHRQGVLLQMPAPGAVPNAPVDEHFAVALAAAIIEAVLLAPRSSRCVAQVAPGPRALVIESDEVSRGRPGLRSVADDCLEWLGATLNRTRDGNHHKLQIRIPQSA